MTFPGTPTTTDPGGIAVPLGHDCPGTEERVLADDCSVEDDGTHPHEDPVPNRAPVEDRPVPDRDLPADADREPSLVWMTALSWTLDRSPIVTLSRSPRTTAPNQTLTESPMSTSPRTVAFPAMNRSPAPALPIAIILIKIHYHAQ